MKYKREKQQNQDACRSAATRVACQKRFMKKQVVCLIKSRADRCFKCKSYNIIGVIYLLSQTWIRIY